MPADLRLATATALLIDESLLTGESAPVAKRSAPVATETVLADRADMVYAGTVVSRGRGWGYAVATGDATELAKIAAEMREEQRVEPPLQRRMARFARVIGGIVAAAAAVAFAVGLARGEALADMFLIAVALAVAAVPEGLPVAVTVALAVGVRRMARRNAVIRRLPAVETLGSATVIGSDKTGTLTENRMTVQQIWAAGELGDVAGAPWWGSQLEPSTLPPAQRPLYLTLLAGVLTNEATVAATDVGFEVRGDPTEAALLIAAERLGLAPEEVRDACPIFAEIPFEPDRQYSASVRERDGRHEIFVKGAPERVLAMCSGMLGPDGPVPLDRESIRAATRELGAQGLRVLAMAPRPLMIELREPEEVDEPEGLTFLGLRGMSDPPRAGVREAIAACHNAGIRVLMITGDHVTTARAIGEELGIARDGAATLTGAELATLDDADLRRKIQSTAIYARVTPEEKLRVVRALRAEGAVVAVTFFLLSANAAEVLAILVALALDWPLPLLAAQILWLNLVTDSVQVTALAFEPGEPDVLRRPPRDPNEVVLSRLLWERIGISAAVMAIGTLALFHWELVTTGSLTEVRTVALTVLVVFQAFQVGNARSADRSLLRMTPRSNPYLFVATIAAVAVHVVAMYIPPMQIVLRVEPLGLGAWVRIILTAATILVAIELHKWLRRLPARRDVGPARPR